ncbi:Uncharacterized protein ChrSV_2275 [Chromobacterium vaccinii]|nr:Uncharacterized protein ChrSW_2275 [Chromobacterium vaccinii]QND89733.1 Uncharacterized protein ChrSV_2275 [Chromobacterium vaccinii]
MLKDSRNKPGWMTLMLALTKSSQQAVGSSFAFCPRGAVVG